MKRSGVAFVLAVWCTFSVAEGLPAQETPASSEQPRKALNTRGKRTLFVNGVAFLDSFDPLITSGSIFQISFRKAKPETAAVVGPEILEDGEIGLDTLGVDISYRAPAYYMHFLHTAGVSIRDGETEAIGQVQLGALKRLGSGLPRMIGLTAHAIYDPWRVGPVVRGEIYDNVGVNIGWMIDVDDGDSADGFYFSVDYFFKLLEDLHLTKDS